MKKGGYSYELLRLAWFFPAVAFLVLLVLDFRSGDVSPWAFWPASIGTASASVVLWKLFIRKFDSIVSLLLGAKYRGMSRIVQFGCLLSVFLIPVGVYNLFMGGLRSAVDAYTYMFTGPTIEFLKRAGDSACWFSALAGAGYSWARVFNASIGHRFLKLSAGRRLPSPSPESEPTRSPASNQEDREGL